MSVREQRVFVFRCDTCGKEVSAPGNPDHPQGIKWLVVQIHQPEPSQRTLRRDYCSVRCMQGYAGPESPAS